MNKSEHIFEILKIILKKNDIIIKSIIKKTNINTFLKLFKKRGNIMMYEEYTALEIAKYIINKCTIDNRPITNLQLQKILYFLQREYLVNQKKCLFEDEIQAWQFGPVVPEVYYQYCGFGSGVITMKYDIMLDENDVKIVNPIIEEKRTKNPWDLVSETHSYGKPWFIVFKGGEGNKDNISKELIMMKG